MTCPGAGIHRGRTRQWTARYGDQLYTIARVGLMDLQGERIRVLMGHRPGSKITDSTYLHTHDRQKIAAARQMEEKFGRLVGLELSGSEILGDG